MPVPKASYPREQTGDPQLDRMQTELARLRGILSLCPFIAGVQVSSKAVDTTATRVEHRLGRAPKGVIALRSSPASAVGFSASQPVDTSVAVNLEATVLATFDLWFF